MANFLEYNPEQAYLLPPTIRDVLGEGHLCFFVHGVVEQLDLREFVSSYSDQGHPAYHPALLLKVWLYAYGLGMTSWRRLEQRIREDLAFRYLAGGAQPDFWTLNQFRKRHGRAMNDIFTQVVELARSLGLGKLGHVAIDSTRIAANAAMSATDSLEKLRAERAKIRKNIRRWQQQCASEDPHEGAGLEVARAAMEKLAGQLRDLPVRLQRLQKSGMRKLSRSDADSRFLPDRRGFTLGYTATLAVSDDHLIVAQQVSRELNDNGLLVPMVDRVQRECGAPPGQVSADSGFFTLQNLQVLQARGMDGYVPDSNLAGVWHHGGMLQQPTRHGALLRMRSKLTSPAGRAIYRRRKAVVEPVIGILKEQRGMRRFRMRGLGKVAAEFALATTALNLTRMWRLRPPGQCSA
jgi:transposase